MAKKTRKTEKPPRPVISMTLTAAERHEQVARKAYELYQQRGAEHGQDWADWFAAERLTQ